MCVGDCFLHIETEIDHSMDKTTSTSQSSPSWRLVDFDLEGAQLLGCGAISLINRCKHFQSDKFYALKILSKVHLLQQNRQHVPLGEKQALMALRAHSSFPFLYGTMQSEDELFFILELLPGGDLLEHIRRVSGLRRQTNTSCVNAPLPCLTIGDTQLITAQLLVALRHVFEKGYTLRDLKPENICFRSNGRVVLIDFDTATSECSGPAALLNATAKSYRKTSEIAAARRNSSVFCGTAQYVSPEAMMECKWSFSSDLFALGSVIYHMLAGEPLFSGPSPFFVMQEIKRGVDAKVFPKSISRHPGAVDLIKKLLHPDPTQRLGVVRREHASTTENGGHTDFTFDVNVFKSTEFFRTFGDDNWALVEMVDDVLYRRDENSGECASCLPQVTYDNTPCHADEYAKYVHEVGDGPLERAANESLEKYKNILQNSGTHPIDNDNEQSKTDRTHTSPLASPSDEEKVEAMLELEHNDSDNDHVEDDMSCISLKNRHHQLDEDKDPASYGVEAAPQGLVADRAWLQDTAS